MPADWRNLTHDILKQIYAYSEDRDLSKCARTCKNWTDPALDHVWFELRAKDIVLLFAILAPLRPLETQTSAVVKRMEFSRRISQRDWERFLRHSSRVRRIVGFSSYYENLDMISEAALGEFFMAKPSTCPILPRCQRLSFCGSLTGDYPWRQFFTGLLHEGIQEIGVDVSIRSSSDGLNFLEEVTWRSPNVTSLKVDSDLINFDDNISASLRSSTSKMRKLQIVHWPSCLLAAKLLSTLEQLPDLQKIHILEETYRVGRESDGILPQTVSPNAFPRLIFLTLQCSLGELCRYLSRADGIAPGLLYLTIDIISTTEPAIFQNALVKIAKAFPKLVSLTITRREDFSRFEDDEPPNFLLTYQNLRPLTTMPHLQTFQLMFEGVVSLIDSQLSSLLAQCPSMRTLRLNQEPTSFLQTELTINVLPKIAQACPQLEDLALYVNTKVESLETSSLHTFERLKTIDLGISLLENKLAVTTLLAQVLPEGCKLISKPAFDLEAEDFFAFNEENSDVREERRNEWAQISEWMSILLKVRRESSERALTKLAVGQT